MKSKLLIVLSLFLLSLSMSFAKVYVIANKSVSDSKLTGSAVAKFYTLDKKSWSGGETVVVFNLRGDNPAKESFFKFIGKQEDDLNKIWMKAKLTGNATPKSVSSEDDMLRSVASTPGAIGYSSKVSGDVKVLAEIN